MFKCRKPDRGKLVGEILTLVKNMPHLFSHPDLDEWRRLTVPVAQLKALCLIVNRKEVNSRTLAEDLEVTRGNVTGIVDRLAEQGLVARKPDPQDRRVIWLEATSKGRELFDKLMEGHSKQLALILDYMELDDLKALNKGLKGLITAVEGHLVELKEMTPKRSDQ